MAPFQANKYSQMKRFGPETCILKIATRFVPEESMATMLQDLRYALCQLRRRPGLTVTAILTLALGIGATTAVFSLVYSILLQPLPYHKSGRLVAIWEEVKYLGSDRPYFEANPRHEQYWKQRATYFSDITLLRQGTAGVGLTNEHPRIVGVVLGYTNLLSVLGVEPELGRAFLPEEGTAGHDHVAIITHDLWQRNFAADPHVLGRSLRLNGSLLQIVGVLPESFHFPKGNVLRSQRSESGSWPATGVSSHSSWIKIRCRSMEIIISSLSDVSKTASPCSKRRLSSTPSTRLSSRTMPQRRRQKSGLTLYVLISSRYMKQ